MERLEDNANCLFGILDECDVKSGGFVQKLLSIQSRPGARRSSALEALAMLRRELLVPATQFVKLVRARAWRLEAAAKQRILEAEAKDVLLSSRSGTSRTTSGAVLSSSSY
ncbi:MAG: hypothetical protein MHM6MM_003327 [Cercozoa sp. M6MM]